MDFFFDAIISPDTDFLCSNHADSGRFSAKCLAKAPEFKSDYHRDEFSPFRYHLNRARSRSKKRGHEIQISIFDLKKQWDRQKGVCPYTGWHLINPETTTDNFGLHIRRASLDRIDSTRGYEPENIQFIAWIANVGKNEFSEGEFLEFCGAVAKYRDLLKNTEGIDDSSSTSSGDEVSEGDSTTDEFLNFIYN